MIVAERLAALYAPARSTVVLVGETGTGKTHLARRLHRMSPRAREPFVDVTAAELGESLAAAQLFGHERGAFTGAVERRAGLFAEAAAGTLMLDDLHLLPRMLQGLLLRALASGFYRPLGAQREYPVLCRVMVGVSTAPDDLMVAGTLLPDLRFRLGHCTIRLPRLAERREDIAALARRFLDECPAETGLAGPAGFEPAALAALEGATWPGNIRDLRATVIAAYLHAQADAAIRLEHLPDHARWTPRYEPHGDPTSNERAIEWALWKAGNRVAAAARLLGVHRNTVSSQLARGKCTTASLLLGSPHSRGCRRQRTNRSQVQR